MDSTSGNTSSGFGLSNTGGGRATNAGAGASGGSGGGASASASGGAGTSGQGSAGGNSNQSASGGGGGGKGAELNNVCLNASDGTVGLSNINLKIHEKEIIGLAGVSGNGQFGVASILQGLTHPSSGEFKLFGQSLIKYDPRYLTKSGVARALV